MEIHLSYSWRGANIQGKKQRWAVLLSIKRKARGAINIKNLSLGGVGFELNGNYLLSSKDVILLRFNLDDPFNSLITKEVEIKKINDNYIGSEFLGKIWKHDVYHLYLKD